MTGTTAASSKGRSVGDIVATIILSVVSLVVAIALFTGAVLWAMDAAPDSWGFALGVYGPILIALLGIALAVIAIVRRKRAFIYPLAAIVLSVVAAWVGGLIVAG